MVPQEGHVTKMLSDMESSYAVIEMVGHSCANSSLPVCRCVGTSKRQDLANVAVHSLGIGNFESLVHLSDQNERCPEKRMIETIFPDLVTSQLQGFQLTFALFEMPEEVFHKLH